MTERMNQKSGLQACTLREQLPESAVRGTGGRTEFLVPRSHHIDDMDTPLTFKLQQGSERRQGSVVYSEPRRDGCPQPCGGA